MPRLTPSLLFLSPCCRRTTVSPSAPSCSPPSLLERAVPSFPHLPVVVAGASTTNTNRSPAFPDLCGMGGTMETREICGAQIRRTSSIPTAAMVDRGAIASPTASIPRAWEAIAGEQLETREIKQHANQTGSAARRTGDLSAARGEPWAAALHRG